MIMGGTLPICPFCKKLLNKGGIKDHIKIKHADKYKQWIENNCPPYWMYDDNGLLRNN